MEHCICISYLGSSACVFSVPNQRLLEQQTAQRLRQRSHGPSLSLSPWQPDRALASFTTSIDKVKRGILNRVRLTKLLPTMRILRNDIQAHGHVSFCQSMPPRLCELTGARASYQPPTPY